MHRIKVLFSFSLLITFLTSSVFAQNKVTIADRYILNHLTELDLTKDDFESKKLNNFYTSKNNGVSHIYFKQIHGGIEVNNAVINVNVNKNNEVIYTGNRFIKNLRNKVNSKEPTMNPVLALQYASMHLDLIETLEDPIELHHSAEHEYIFGSSGISQEDIPIHLVYQKINDQVILCWEIDIHSKESTDVWNVLVDASSGELIKKYNSTLYCFHDSNKTTKKRGGNHKHVNNEISIPDVSVFSNMMEGSYTAFSVPIENPLDGSRSTVTDNPFSTPSPFGWHDNDGIEGAEFTFTRGNNVHAYLDEDGNNMPDPVLAEGGSALNFDFPFDIDSEPEDMQEAGLTNMFYMNNYMHDLSYIYGFDEEAGNYQQNNYGNGGEDGDYVRAEGNDGSGIANASFFVSPDGVRGRMTMFLWESRGRGKLRVEAPSELAGHIFATGDAEGPQGFGPQITTTPLTGELALIDSGGSDPTFACTEVLNANEVNGKIAVVDRGTCDFSLKAYNAQVAGAIGIIVCNTAENLIELAGGDMANEVVIPMVSIRNSSCDTIKNILANGVVSIVENPIDPPSLLSGMFSNGVIAHEYAHGISTRLTGGPAEDDCLRNDEQMGEGWSDFFLLATSAKNGQDGTEARTVGAYLTDDPIGIRRFPYSTDGGINSQTMQNIKNTTTPHQLGEIWAGVTWDLHWALVDEYGFDPDVTNKESGNAIAMQLIIDGLKMQPCSPGFVDGRDAIIAADLENNGGVNECLIWNVFANRGIGLNADQVDTDDRSDNIQDFDVPTPCVPSSIKDIEEATSYLKVYPNPSNGTFQIHIKSELQANAQISLLSLSGKILIKNEVSLYEGENILSFSAGQVPSGIYFLGLLGENMSEFSKVIIE